MYIIHIFERTQVKIIALINSRTVKFVTEIYFSNETSQTNSLARKINDTDIVIQKHNRNRKKIIMKLVSTSVSSHITFNGIVCSKNESERTLIHRFANCNGTRSTNEFSTKL